MAHYGQIEEVEWLLLTGYRRTFTNALYNATIAGPPLPTRQGHLTPRKILALQIAAKPLQIATWLLLTAYRNLPTPYPTVSSPTPYRHLFSQNRGTDSPPLKKVHAGFLALALKQLFRFIVGYFSASRTTALAGQSRNHDTYDKILYDVNVCNTRCLCSFAAQQQAILAWWLSY